MGQILQAAGEVDGQTQLEMKDRYSIGSTKLGEGSFGTVWKAIDRQTGAVVAVKQMSKAKLNASGVTAHKCIDREVIMMRACPHDNIGQMHGAFEDATYFYLAMELCEGGDLNEAVSRRNWEGISEQRKAEWSYQMCSAVAALHKKRICHRDIKPGNFMLTRDSKIKLSDFGLAVFLPEGSVLSDRVGTPAFMAPEIYTSRTQGYSFPADVWAAGLCIYMLIFQGKHPFVDSRGQLTESSLLAGHLSFGEEEGSFSGLIRSLTMMSVGEPEGENLRDLPEVRRCLSYLVDVDDTRRISAASAARSAWINQIGKLSLQQSIATPRQSQSRVAKASRRKSRPLDVAAKSASRRNSRPLDAAAENAGAPKIPSMSPSSLMASQATQPQFVTVLPNLLESAYPHPSSHSKAKVRSPSKERGFVTLLDPTPSCNEVYSTALPDKGKMSSAKSFYVRV
mmetsp:Transcript_98976/g.176331  ORF Transcript_98976/g.176331 Transcript_98976/m.176331 type:complete len:452 (-) Transcript_98976:239-1594(-)